MVVGIVVVVALSLCSAFHLPKCVCVVCGAVRWWWWWCVCVYMCVCVQYVCVKCMCSVRLFVCVHTLVCVSCACGLFFIGIIFCTCMFLPYFFFFKCVYELTSCAFTLIQVITSSSSSFHSSSVVIYACMCAVFFLSVYTPLTSHLIYISYVLYMFGFFFFFFYIFCSLCMCIISRIALVPQG